MFETEEEIVANATGALKYIHGLEAQIRAWQKAANAYEFNARTGKVKAKKAAVQNRAKPREKNYIDIWMAIPVGEKPKRGQVYTAYLNEVACLADNWDRDVYIQKGNINSIELVYTGWCRREFVFTGLVKLLRSYPLWARKNRIEGAMSATDIDTREYRKYTVNYDQLADLDRIEMSLNSIRPQPGKRTRTGSRDVPKHVLINGKWVGVP